MNKDKYVTDQNIDEMNNQAASSHPTEDIEERKTIKELGQDYLFLFSISGMIVFLDQWTKNLVLANLKIGSWWMPLEWLEPYVRIVHWRNRGAAFGIFQNGAGIFMVFAVIVTVAIIYYFPQIPKNEWPLRLALSLQMGGAIGNFVDRLRHDMEVIDFVSVGNFPVFNVADSSITVGAVVLLIGIWMIERQEKLKQKAEELELASSE